LALWVGLQASTAWAHEAPKPAPSDKVVLVPGKGVLEMGWADYEDRVKGSLSPQPPRAGQPLQVQVHVGSYYGEPFDGPVTLTLREEGSTHGQTVTVRRGEANWTTEFTPENSGPHQLDISFRTTHLKVLHARIEVAPSPIPRFILWSLLGVVGVAAVTFGVRSLLREAEPMPPPPLEADVPRAAAEPTPAPAPTVTVEPTPSPAVEAAPTAEPAPAPVVAAAPPSEAPAPASEPAPAPTAEPAPAPESPKASA
jgi:hypothetical protein